MTINTVKNATKKYKKVQQFANDNVSALGLDLAEMELKVAAHMHALLTDLGIDVDADHNMQQTPQRVAKMFVHETMRGRFYPAPVCTDFPNVRNADQLITIKNLTVESMCSHHMQPIRGNCWIGILPDTKVLGLSKYSRIVDWFARRPQIQEELTVQIAEYIQDILKCQGIAVLIEAEHLCMSVRGVKEHSSTTETCHLIGAFLESPGLKAEFYAAVARSRRETT